MSNGRIRRLIFDELKSGLKQRHGGELPYPVLQHGVVITDKQKKEYKPNETHLEVHLIPAPAATETLQGDHVRYTGIYQIDVKILLDIDVDLYGDANLELETISDELQDVFKINLRLVDANGFAVQILSPLKIREARREKGSNWWVAFCYFDYRADTNI